MQFGGFGVLRSGGYFVLLHAFIGGCQIGSEAAQIEIKFYFLDLCFSSDSGFKEFSGSACRVLFILSFHALFCL